MSSEIKAPSVIANSIFEIQDTINWNISDKAVRETHSQNGNIANLFNVINNTNQLWGIQKWIYRIGYKHNFFTVAKILTVVQEIMKKTQKDPAKPSSQEVDFQSRQPSGKRRKGFENSQSSPIGNNPNPSKPPLIFTAPNNKPLTSKLAKHIPVGMSGINGIEAKRNYIEAIMRIKNSTTDQQKQKRRVANFINNRLPIDLQKEAKEFASGISVK